MKDSYTPPSPKDPHLNRDGMDVGDVIETAKDINDYFSKDKDAKVIHCAKCNKPEQSAKYSKAATAFSLGAFLLSAVALGMQFLKEPAKTTLDPEAWDELRTMIEQIKPTSSVSSSSLSSTAPQAINLPFKPAASSKPRVTSDVKSSVQVVAIASSVPVSSASVVVASSAPVSSALSSQPASSSALQVSSAPQKSSDAGTPGAVSSVAVTEPGAAGGAWEPGSTK